MIGTLERAAWALAMTLSLSAGSDSPRALPAPAPSTLSVWSSGGWRAWWRSDRAPARWVGADRTVTEALRWETLARGLEWTSLRLGCGAPVWRARVIVARLDPRQLDLSLTMDLSRDGHPAWTLDRAPADAWLAVNAGQFVGAMPWGWVVVDGVERLSPGRGPLASAVAIDDQGRVRWAHGDTLAANPGVRVGFQSYPTLLAGEGRLPTPLVSGEGIDLAHRDARLALGQTRDGRLLIVLTRFDAVGEMAGAVPLGPTTPEMAALMGALGASDAVMLDGGLSAQLSLRDSGGHRAQRWRGLRKVPLALLARAPSEAAARTR